MMPSPFPGMDPYLEGPDWLDFHNSFCIGLRAALVRQLVPRYFVSVEQRLVLETDEGRIAYRGDVAVGDDRPADAPPEASVGTLLAPVVLTWRRFEPSREVYLEITEPRTGRVVTVVEVLSPWNKSGRGYDEYLLKRDDLLRAGVNLLELDLLRGGRRLPTVERLPAGDYFAFVSRGERPDKAEAYAWGLRDRLPTLPLPLTPGEEATVPLQQVFDRVFDEAAYAYSPRYGRNVAPPFPPEVATWADEIVSAARLRRESAS